jgi:hypothetical protein
MTVLSAAFPSHLQDFVATVDWKSGSSVPPFVFFDLISLTRETGNLLMLPAIYLRYCLEFSIDSVLKGIKRPDGTSAVLSPQDQHAVLQGWHKLLHMQYHDIYYFMTKDRLQAAGCYMAGACSLAHARFFFTEIGPSVNMVFQPWKDEWDMDMCGSCIALGRMLVEDTQDEAWDQLPSIFGLPGWNDLSKE